MAVGLERGQQRAEFNTEKILKKTDGNSGLSFLTQTAGSDAVN
ncbi:hypothetical protein IMSAGC013_04805 [Lachnospiraceae bacterium]|nr:hypothetical protein IMSAGC013_04805 [Lachnospiraceae bacterium]